MSLSAKLTSLYNNSLYVPEILYYIFCCFNIIFRVSSAEQPVSQDSHLLTMQSGSEVSVPFKRHKPPSQIKEFRVRRTGIRGKVRQTQKRVSPTTCLRIPKKNLRLEGDDDSFYICGKRDTRPYALFSPQRTSTFT